MHALKAGLPPMPDRIAALPMSERGYPVPFFVAYVDGKPEFRIADARKKHDCIRENLCWVCGQRTGKYKCFPIGPMCVVNRNTAEPPCHLDCAEWSVQACPFILNPNMVRRENSLPPGVTEPAGIAIKRNPGVLALYICSEYKLTRDGGDGILFSLGEPLGVSWWKEGRTATREEVAESVASGLPLLWEHCYTEDDRSALAEYVARAERWFPKS